MSPAGSTESWQALDLQERIPEWNAESSTLDEELTHDQINQIHRIFLLHSMSTRDVN